MTDGEAPKRDIIVDILGHPQNAPSLEELVFMNPDIGREEIREHLQELVDDSTVSTLDAGQADIKDAPENFYSLTKTAKNEYAGTENAWRREYDAVEKTERIETLQNLPRPDVETPR